MSSMLTRRFSVEDVILSSFSLYLFVESFIRTIVSIRLISCMSAVAMMFSLLRVSSTLLFAHTVTSMTLVPSSISYTLPSLVIKSSFNISTGILVNSALSTGSLILITINHMATENKTARIFRPRLAVSFFFILCPSLPQSSLLLFQRLILNHKQFALEVFRIQISGQSPFIGHAYMSCLLRNNNCQGICHFRNPHTGPVPRTQFLTQAHIIG